MMMKTVLNNQYKKFVIVLGLLLIGSCLVSFVYMTLFRWVDYAICIPSIARKVGAPLTMDGIESYLLETITPGMRREEVLEILKKFGPVDVRSQTASYPPGEFRDTIFIKSCRHPLNNLEIYAFYSLEGRLISISLQNND